MLQYTGVGFIMVTHLITWRDEMIEDEINTKAQELVDQHLQDMAEAKAALTRDMLDAGYSPNDWVICDNMEGIRAGHTLDYRCWASKRNPTEL